MIFPYGLLLRTISLLSPEERENPRERNAPVETEGQTNMKFSCEKALLQAAISTASRAVSSKSSIPALEGILLEAGQELRLTGYNLDTGIRTIVPADISEEGTLVLAARLFGEIIRKLPDDIVTFQTDHYMVHITCGPSEFNILGTDPEEFPELPTVEYQNSLTLPQSRLKAMIAQTILPSATTRAGRSTPVPSLRLTKTALRWCRWTASGWPSAMRPLTRRTARPNFPLWYPVPPCPRWRRSAPTVTSRCR